MIILDTNVISEVMRPNPDERVTAWLDQQPRRDLFLCSPVLGELLVGLEAMQASKRKSSLLQVLQEIRAQVLTNPVLPYDERAAVCFAKLVISAKNKGFQISVGDGQIAAIALQKGYTVASRDTSPFAAADVAVINPWGEWVNGS